MLTSMITLLFFNSSMPQFSLLLNGDNNNSKIPQTLLLRLSMKCSEYYLAHGKLAMSGSY